jgi:hypothetical protein
VADEVLALTAVVRPILTGVLYALKADVVAEEIIAKFDLPHNDDSLPTVAFASDAVKILIQIVALHVRRTVQAGRGNSSRNLIVAGGEHCLTPNQNLARKTTMG